MPDDPVEAFAMETPVELFGRSNSIKTRSGDTIAMIVEFCHLPEPVSLLEFLRQRN